MQASFVGCLLLFEGASFPRNPVPFSPRRRLHYADNADRIGAINILSRGMQKLRDEGQDTAQACAGRGTAARIACEVSGAVMPPAAGTRRSDPGAAQCRPWAP